MVARHDKPIDRPIDKKVLAEARQLSANYRLVIEPRPKVGFAGRVYELPGVLADGPTPSKCLADLESALTFVLATMLEEGERLPLPESESRRREQVNIRLTPEEKSLLAEESTRRGFRGISEFIRTTVLRACHLNV